MSASAQAFTSRDLDIEFTFRPFILASPSYLDGCLDTGSTTPEWLRGIYAFIGLVSMVCSLFVGITIFYNPKLRIHPSKLIGFMCICEGISCFNALIWAVGPLDFICYFGLHYLYSWSMFNKISKLQALVFLCESNQVVFQFFQFLSLAFNFCLCHDLIMTLKNPFYPGKRRMKFYFFGSIIVIAILTFFSRGNLRSECTVKGYNDGLTIEDWQDTYINDTSKSLISAFSLTIYILIALSSCVYAYRRLTRPGMSKEIRIFFIRKHIAYVATFIIIWTFYLANTYFSLYYSTAEESTSDNDKIKKLRAVIGGISLVAAMSTGFCMAIIRVSEPYFQFLIKKKIAEWFGILLDEKEIQNSNRYINDTLVTFLTSSLNVELVHVILKSIAQYSSGKVVDGANQHTYDDKEFTRQYKFLIDTVKIKNPEDWKVAKLPDFLLQDYEYTTSKSTTVSMKTPRNAVDPLDILPSLVSPTPIDASEEIDNRLVLNEDINITEYAPDVFAFLRNLDGINNDVIKESLSPDKNRDMVFKAGESQGKSGSFFFFSHDKRFIIKTMTQTDLATFKKVFKQYFHHVCSRPNSLLARVYGVYTVKMEEIEPVSLILMGNTKRCDDKLIEHVFDLKGSFVNREVKGKNLKNTATLKDINLLNLCKEKIFLRFRLDDRFTLLDAIERDVEMLKAHNIMDYSLLFAVQTNPHYKGSYGGQKTRSAFSEGEDALNLKLIESKFEKTRHTYLSASGRYIYHIGIIDYLQDYNFEKIMENKFKMFINKDGAEISAIEPKSYATRYLKFMRDKVFIDQKEGNTQNETVLQKFKTRKF